MTAFDPETYLDTYGEDFSILAISFLDVMSNLRDLQTAAKSRATDLKSSYNIAEARASLPDIFAAAHFADKRILITKHGKPYAQIVGSNEAGLLEVRDAILDKFNETAKIVHGAINGNNASTLTASMSDCTLLLCQRLGWKPKTAYNY